MKIDLRLASPLEKVFLDEAPHGGYRRASALLTETASFQAAWTILEGPSREYVSLEVAADVPVHVRMVKSVPVRFAAFPDADADYLRKTPGLYPDLLDEIGEEKWRAYAGLWTCAWIDVDHAPAGTHAIEVLLKSADGATLARATFTLDVIPAQLPKQEFIHTKWFHCDALCHYYGVEMWSEAFWTICENFVAAMPRRGINMLLTPIHTPPLDTRAGGERMTCQLVDVYLDKGVYSFGFARLGRWVEMARRCGITYFEMAHLFTQWGARHAPKIVACVDGTEKRIFGWETDATGAPYRAFLGAYLPALTAELRRLGIADRCSFHISDEPGLSMLADYRAARDMVAEFLDGFPVMDALSSYEFYATGAVAHPIPASDHMEPFLKAGIEGLWTYYCLGQYKLVSNTFLAMSGARTRILGFQLYKYRIAGFLQWAYNFYGAQFSDYQVDPFRVTDGDGFAPAGDTFQVYPGKDGKPLESLRMMAAAEAMADLCALKLLESLKGRDFVMAILEDGIEPITFTCYPRSADYLLETRERVNRAIEEAIRS